MASAPLTLDVLDEKQTVILLQMALKVSPPSPQFFFSSLHSQNTHCIKKNCVIKEEQITQHDDVME